MDNETQTQAQAIADIFSKDSRDRMEIHPNDTFASFDTWEPTAIVEILETRYGLDAYVDEDRTTIHVANAFAFVRGPSNCAAPCGHCGSCYELEAVTDEELARRWDECGGRGMALAGVA